MFARWDTVVVEDGRFGWTTVYLGNPLPGEAFKPGWERYVELSEGHDDHPPFFDIHYEKQNGGVDLAALGVELENARWLSGDSWESYHRIAAHCYLPALVFSLMPMVWAWKALRRQQPGEASDVCHLRLRCPRHPDRCPECGNLISCAAPP